MPSRTHSPVLPPCCTWRASPPRRTSGIGCCRGTSTEHGPSTRRPCAPACRDSSSRARCRRFKGMSRASECRPTAAPRPTTVYGCSKLFGEALGRYHADLAGLGVACLRMGAVRSDRLGRPSWDLAGRARPRPVWSLRLSTRPFPSRSSLRSRRPRQSGSTPRTHSGGRRPSRPTDRPLPSASPQKSSSISASPPSPKPITSSSRPSGPPSNARAVPGAKRIASHWRTSRISSSILTRPLPAIDDVDLLVRLVPVGCRRPEVRGELLVAEAASLELHRPRVRTAPPCPVRARTSPRRSRRRPSDSYVCIRPCRLPFLWHRSRNESTSLESEQT